MWRKLLAILLAYAAGIGLLVAAEQSPGRVAGFQAITVDAKGPRAVWGKGTGDINQDGLVDILVGGHKPREPGWIERIRTKLGGAEREITRGELVWYRNPDWKKVLISDQFAIRTDIEVADIDTDGFVDVAAVTNQGLVIFFGPDWQATIVDEQRLHDLEITDLDRDGDVELVSRNQSLFGYENGNQVFVYEREATQTWARISLDVPHGEGLKASDINGDGYPDIVVNQSWLVNPAGQGLRGDWQAINYSRNWIWPDVFIDVADMDDDGEADIILSPSEAKGQHHRISWFESREAGRVWQEHVVDANVEAIHHFVGAADFNLDGRMDVAAAEMNQGADPDEIKIYYNFVTGWEKSVLSQKGSHSMRIIDFDNDGDPDLVGANWEFADPALSYPVTLWRNTVIQNPDN